MTTYDLRKKTDASTGQRVISLGNDIRVERLENRINKQEEKLNKIFRETTSKKLILSLFLVN